MKFLLGMVLLISATQLQASDWGGKSAVIEKMYIYATSVIIVQGDVYAGKAGCANNNKWSFYWSSLDEKVADRVYSALLAAYASKTPIKPIFHPTECGPENAKKFTGSFVFE
ncbi:hypothetical protein [Aliikangiella coralliicola]|uniref:Rap1a immunity protein domain-containing protein n=1 Tax=Aliikangiella coralliicola TaxID=2592383 RepID=A0A545UIW5_9GAMM|nr:hypothetical protein [Aliikangiella coralliicola]TQV89406.1 hypothetical protein FLL46_00555 [Aliikangiella coralliicola]